MTRQNDILLDIVAAGRFIDSAVDELADEIAAAETGNLAEVYEGARDWLQQAKAAVTEAKNTLAPEDAA